MRPGGRIWKKGMREAKKGEPTGRRTGYIPDEKGFPPQPRPRPFLRPALDEYAQCLANGATYEGDE
jgi:hypothetical protein